MTVHTLQVYIIEKQKEVLCMHWKLPDVIAAKQSSSSQAHKARLTASHAPEGPRSDDVLKRAHAWGEAIS